MNLQLDPHERMIFIGKTSSGKTEFAKHLLRKIAEKMPVVIIDPKEQWLGDYPVWETDKRKPGTVDKPHLIDTYNPKFHVQVLQPDEEDDDRLEKLCYTLLKLRNIIIFFDETEGTGATAHHVPAGIRKLWKTGRSKGLGAWVASQTPSGIPRIWKSQADKFFVFKVGREDIDLAAYISNATKEDVANLSKYEYLYYDTGADMETAEWNPPIPFKEKKAS